MSEKYDILVNRRRFIYTVMNKINQSSFEELKTRNWAFLMYKENLASVGEWKQFLIDTGAEICVSPLHQYDLISEEDYESKKDYYIEKGLKVGDLKKPHYHVIVCYPGPTTQHAIENRVCIPLNATKPFPLISVPGYYHYLWHDPEYGYGDKFPYKKSEIWKCGGFDIAKYIDLSQTQTFKARQYIVDFIKLNDIKSFSVLLDVFQNLHMDLEYKVLVNSKNFFMDYLKSRTWSRERDFQLMYKIQNPTTGKIEQVLFKPEDFGLVDNI